MLQMWVSIPQTKNYFTDGCSGWGLNTVNRMQKASVVPNPHEILDQWSIKTKKY